MNLDEAKILSLLQTCCILITFLALAMIIDPENLPDEDIEAMASGIEEFFAFMMENFEG